MEIILSQRIDIQSEYDDIPFSSYHYPSTYRNQIRSGDRFIYYQGDRSKREHRCYFGCGVVGVINPDPEGAHFYAQILEGRQFPNRVPIYMPGGGFYESLGYSSVRKSATPAWQRSIRRISGEAFDRILTDACVKFDRDDFVATIEQDGQDPLDVLRGLNQLYQNTEVGSRISRIGAVIDRGAGVVRALKSLLGAKCQVCGWKGFSKRDDTGYIEAHHIAQLSYRERGSRCTDNIILVCPNCHRQIHHGGSVIIRAEGDLIYISMPGAHTRITRNTLDRLGKLLTCRRASVGNSERPAV